MPRAFGSACSRCTMMLSFSPASMNGPSWRMRSQTSAFASPSSAAMAAKASQPAMHDELDEGVAGARGRRRAEDLDRRVGQRRRRSRSSSCRGWRTICAVDLDLGGERLEELRLGQVDVRAVDRMGDREAVVAEQHLGDAVDAVRLAESRTRTRFIAREAPVMSGKSGPTPPQKTCIPPPVPVDSTTGALSPVMPANCSATAWV